MTPPHERENGKARRARASTQRGIKHSWDFTPGPDGGAEYKLRGIPSRMWRTVRAKARREQRSVRCVVLELLRTWIDRDTSNITSNS